MQTKRIILSLDQATHTGFAIYKGRQIIKSGTIYLNPLNREKDLMEFLTTTCKRYKVTDIVAEDIYKKKGKEHAFVILSSLKGVINLYDQTNKTTLTYQPAIMMQRHVLGHVIDGADYKRKLLQAKGNKQKISQIEADHRSEVKTWVKRRIQNIGYTLTSDRDDESDAIGHLLLYLYRNELPLELPDGSMYNS